MSTMLVDSFDDCAPPSVLLLARGPPRSAPASRVSHIQNRPEFKFAAGHGGARIGAGRPRKSSPPQIETGISRWYVARTGYGQTALADRDMRTKGFTIFAPTIFKAATPPRRDSTGVMRPGKPDRADYLFVRYVMVRLNLSDPGWRDVLDCDGVERIISGGHLNNDGIGIPIAVPDSDIAAIRELLNEVDCLDPRVFREKPIEPGTRLRVTGGALLDREGICELSDGARVVLLMQLLGRPLRIEVAQSGVEAV